MPQPELFTWEKDMDAVCARIRSVPSMFKVILKTRNETLLLKPWLDHYLTMLGPKGRIVVLDNMSTEPAIFETYAAHAGNLVVAQYAGNVDTAHSLKRFGPLYAAVRDSSLFYALLDTDEFLFLYTGQKLVRDKRVLSCLEHNRDADFFPSFRLDNVYGHADRFLFSEEAARTAHRLGKPLLHSAKAGIGLTVPVGHTMDMPLFFFGKTPLCFVLLHRNSVSREQKIKANMQKLVSFGFIRDERDYDALRRLDRSAFPLEYLWGYAEEAQRLLGDDGGKAQALEGISHVTVGDDGSLAFSAPELERAFKTHVNGTNALLPLLGLDINTIKDKRMRLNDVLAS